ncbi:hypothetical protein V6N13_024209 [Hibiscus sabdariffa]|uniref:Peptidase M3A/M3B catalytic domain-containing protein n=1 Tax=Hibiscus sabdariffa TaxID=183260 RepID=A0ABR2BWT6_9ROSI
MEQSNLKNLSVVVEGKDISFLVGGWISKIFVDGLHVIAAVPKDIGVVEALRPISHHLIGVVPRRRFLLHISSCAEIEKKAPLQKHILYSVSHMEIQSDLMNEQVYTFKRCVLQEVLEQNDNVQSLKQNIVSYLVWSQLKLRVLLNGISPTKKIAIISISKWIIIGKLITFYVDLIQREGAKLMTEIEIDGLPATALELAAQSAVSKGHENATVENGPWMITLDAPSFISVMQHAHNSALREEVYHAYITQASSGDLDTTPIINQILKLRLEKAKLLNYNNYVGVCMETKMAIVDIPEELLERLRSASWNDV